MSSELYHSALKLNGWNKFSLQEVLAVLSMGLQTSQQEQVISMVVCRGWEGDGEARPRPAAPPRLLRCRRCLSCAWLAPKTLCISAAMLNAGQSSPSPSYLATAGCFVGKEGEDSGLPLGLSHLGKNPSRQLGSASASLGLILREMNKTKHLAK